MNTITCHKNLVSFTAATKRIQAVYDSFHLYQFSFSFLSARLNIQLVALKFKDLDKYIKKKRKTIYKKFRDSLYKRKKSTKNTKPICVISPQLHPPPTPTFLAKFYITLINFLFFVLFKISDESNPLPQLSIFNLL